MTETELVQDKFLDKYQQQANGSYTTNNSESYDELIEIEELLAEKLDFQTNTYHSQHFEPASTRKYDAFAKEPNHGTVTGAYIEENPREGSTYLLVEISTSETTHRIELPIEDTETIQELLSVVGVDTDSFSDIIGRKTYLYEGNSDDTIRVTNSRIESITNTFPLILGGFVFSAITTELYDFGSEPVAMVIAVIFGLIGLTLLLNLIQCSYRCPQFISNMRNPSGESVPVRET